MGKYDFTELTPFERRMAIRELNSKKRKRESRERSARASEKAASYLKKVEAEKLSLTKELGRLKKAYNSVKAIVKASFKKQ